MKKKYIMSYAMLIFKYNKIKEASAFPFYAEA